MSWSQRYWAWLVSWYSSTSTWRNVAGVAVADLLEQLEHVDRAHEQVVEVHGVHPVQLALVGAVDIGDGLLEERADHLRVRVRVAQLVLGVGDLVVDRPRREPLGVDPELVEIALDQPPRVRLVVDREPPRVPSLSAWARSIRAQAAWKVITHIARTRRPTSSSARSRISPAALFVNVIARISFGFRRRCDQVAIRWVSTRVLPEPAPARISSGPSP